MLFRIKNNVIRGDSILGIRILFLFVFLVCGNCISAADNTAVLSGKVVDKESSSILIQVNIILVNSGSGDKYQTASDISGSFSLSKIKKGKYSLKASHIGYLDYEKEVDLTESDKLEMNIYMNPAEIEIEKINVTSSKTEVTLQQTPSSISVVGKDEIFNKNILTFDNVLEEVQGVTINRSSGINVSSLSIRGSSDVAGGGIGNRVLLLLDGRPSLTGDSKGALWSLIPVSIIERTEVVKGAFSSLYGSSAIGGVVNVITKKPTYKPFTAVNMNYGFYEKLSDSLKFTDNLQTISGADIIHSNTIKKFSYLANLNYKRNDGYSQQSAYDFYSLTGKFTYDVLSNRDLEATIQYTKSNSDFPRYWRKDAGSIAEPYKVAEYYIGDKIKKKSQSYDLFYRAIPNSSSKYTTRFYYYYLNSNSYYNPKNPVSIQFADTGQALNTFIDSYNIGNISQVDFQLGRSNYLISGLDFQMNIVKSDPEEILYGNQQMNNFGLFVQDQMKIIKDGKGDDILTSTIGVRGDYNKVISGISSFQLSPKISFVYTPVTLNSLLKNTSFRILGGRAFRSPSIAEIYFKKELFGGFDFIYNPNLKPEEMYSFEVGVKKQYLNRFTLDISFFYNYYENLIQYVNIGNSIYGPFQVQNVANSQIKGFEFYLDYNSRFQLFKLPLDYYFNLGYTFLQARDLSANRKDDFLPYKPEHNFNFTANITYFDFNLNVNGRYLSKVDEVLFYKFEEPKSYFLLNTKLSRKITGKLSFFISIDNLLNESYQELERIQAPNRNYNSGFSFEF
ncbi:MAG: TonB-dependent receptor [Bacteroidetes bacterium]|nr:TonB-dependent receptor [Bacteroidota bacterium]